jgi:UDP-N-acetylglucosamine 2-epimerase (non-hydrolysing)
MHERGLSELDGKSVAVIFGTRPEAIKLAPVIRELPAAPLIINTGQHRELLDPLLRLMRIEPDVDLDVMRDNQSLSGLTARLTDSLGETLRKHRPEAVIVQGDTTTALCGALAAFYERIPVAHVEAGLRSGVLHDPFPEEVNRRLVTELTRWHFAPTPRAAAALHSEGIAAEHVEITGNTVIDNLFWALEHAQGRCAFASSGRRRILVTLHRRENQGARMRAIAEVLARLAGRGDVEIVLPLHRSPSVREALLPLREVPGVTLTEALDYPDFTATLAACDLVVTDSGGVQEEAPSLGKPVVVARETTERPEAIEAGAATLAGTSPSVLFETVTSLLDDAARYAAMAEVVNPFGDGRAARRVASRMLAEL